MLGVIHSLAFWGFVGGFAGGALGSFCAGVILTRAIVQTLRAQDW